MDDTTFVRSSIPNAGLLWCAFDTRRRPERRDGVADQRPRTEADARLDFFTDDLRRRLRPACRHWSEADFEALVHDIASMKVRWTETDRAD